MGIKYYEDPILGKGRALVDTNSDLETRVDALEIAVGIIEEGGEVVQGGFFCGDWTDENTGAIIFGAWTASAS